MNLIEPNGIYSRAEIESLLGRTLAREVAAVSLCKDHYFGGVVLEYLQKLGRSKIETAFIRNNSLANAAICTKQTTNPEAGATTSTKRGKQHDSKTSRPRRLCFDNVKPEG